MHDAVHLPPVPLRVLTVKSRTASSGGRTFVVLIRTFVVLIAFRGLERARGLIW
jgi:hypothetical protein